MRCTEINRETKETQIQLSLNIDGSGTFQGTSGIGFFDHMLTAFAVHGGFDLRLEIPYGVDAFFTYNGKTVALTNGFVHMKIEP